MKELKKIYYLSSTHWDREWYQSFQGFRWRLVQTTDQILDTLENDEAFTHFTFDGQTIVLDDYTKIKPENRGRLTKLIREGRISVGPWYVMPDEYLVSGESLVRNLQLGNRLAKEYGAVEPMKYGYVCDIFGHIAQLPQILRGCGIKGALLGRGTNDFDTPCHFSWQSPDGSACYTFKVPESYGYGSFWYDVWRPYFMDGDSEMRLKNAIAYIEREQARSDIPYVVLMDGMDHEKIHAEAPELARQLSKHFGCPVVFDSLERLADELEQNYRDSLTVKVGERNATGRAVTEHNMLITHTLSSRYDLKKANDECQIMAEKWAEPLCAMGVVRQNTIPGGFLLEAYRQYVKCHAHDSICGCSIDTVHRDMHYRFRQAGGILQEITRAALWSQYSGDEEKTDLQLLAVFNPLPFERQETITAEVQFNKDYPYRFFEQSSNQVKNGFYLRDAQGNSLPYQLCGIQEIKQKDVYTVSFQATLPPCSKTEFQLVPAEKPSRYMGTLLCGGNCAENRFIRLSVQDNGTVSIEDKQSGRVYSDLIHYVDDAEIGDGWFHLSPVNNKEVSSKGFAHSISVVEDGISKVSFEITTEMVLPKSCSYPRRQICRSGDSAVMLVVTKLTLTDSSPYVDVETRVENNVLDHRLRVFFPTGTGSETYMADQAFTFVERRAGIDYATGDWKEHEMPEKAFSSIICRRDARGNGLAFLSGGGLHEAAALEDEAASIGVTLFRAFSKTVSTDGEPDGQLQGSLQFSYRLLPVREETTAAQLCCCKDAFQTGIKYLNFSSTRKPQVGKAMVSLEAKQTVLSAMKPGFGGEDTLVLRLVNYGDDAETAVLRFGFPVQKAYLGDLLENSLTALSCEDKLEILCLPHEIKTVIIVPHAV